MTAPSTTRDRGYMGDPARGASLGRASTQPGGEFAGKLHLARIRLDSGGYGKGGAYWGHGGWLWEAWDDAGEVYLTGRVWAVDRGAARDRILAEAGVANWWALNPPRASTCLEREAAKDAVREQLGDAVRFFR